MKKMWLIAAAVAGLAVNAMAGVHVSVGIGFPVLPPPVVVAPPPVYVPAPRPVVIAPPPVYVAPAPRVVYYAAPPPVVVAPPPVYAPGVYIGFGPRWYGHGRWGHPHRHGCR